MDFATRCDLLSDSIDRRKQAGYFDPSQIGEEVDGPAVYDENNPFMEGEFTQEEKRNLSEKQMAGELAANAAKHVADPKIASAIRKAAYNAAIVALRAKRTANEVKDEKDAEDEKAAEDDAKEQKTAMMAELYNRLRRQANKAKKSEEDESEEDESEEEPEEEPEESEDEDAGAAKDSKKTAKLFNLYA
jgi:hypothetical protein